MNIIDVLSCFDDRNMVRIIIQGHGMFLLLIIREKWVRIWYIVDWICFHEIGTS